MSVSSTFFGISSLPRWTCSVEGHPEVADHGHPFAAAARDLVELGLHPGGELGIDDLGEVAGQQSVRRKASSVGCKRRSSSWT